MNSEARIKAFAALGAFLGESNNRDETEALFHRAHHHNAWFTPENCRLACDAWSEQLTIENLSTWLRPYNIPAENKNPRRIGLVMAGNIPLVGFHDLLCVLIHGDRAVVKLSSDDKILPEFIIKKLQETEPGFSGYITITDRLSDYDAVIATGSNNTARYFEYYFRNHPSIIRKNRNSAAVLDGNESPEELQQLGREVFQYFGLGCRNVSKLYLPRGYDIGEFYRPMESQAQVADHHKYMNNYTFHKALFLMDQVQHLDNGFLLLKEENTTHSPMAVMHYEYYDSPAVLNEALKAKKEELQCIVSHNVAIESRVPFGKAQEPALNDYADGVDTISFLQSLPR
jgi:hypothetical protein